MNQKEIIRVSNKIFGLYFITQTFLYAKQVVYYLAGLKFLGTDNLSVFFYLGQSTLDLIFYGFVAWLLIAKSSYVAEKLSDKTEEKIQLTTTKSDLIELVIIGISLTVILNSIPEILNKITQYLYFNDYSKENKNFFWDDKSRKADMVYSAFKLAIGLLSITNSRLLAKRLTRIGDKDEKLEKE